MTGTPDQAPEPENESPEPAPQARSGSVRMLAIALAVVVVGAVAAVFLILQSTVPQGDLDDAEAQLSTTQADLATARADLASTQQQVSDAAEHATTLEGQIGDLEGNVSTLEGTIARSDSDLAASQAEVESLTADVAAADQQAADAENAIRAAAGELERLSAVWAAGMAWDSWWNSNTDLFVELERLEADLAAIDAVVLSQGLGDNWEDWSGTDFVIAVRRIDPHVDNADDGALELAFDRWVRCITDEQCLLADVELKGALWTAHQEYLARLAELLDVEETA